MGRYLRDMGIPFVDGNAGPFIWCDFSVTGMKSYPLMYALLDDRYRVFVAPGYDNLETDAEEAAGACWIRIGMVATPKPNVEEGMKRIARYLADNGFSKAGASGSASRGATSVSL